MKGTVRQSRETRQDLVNIFRQIARSNGLGTARRFLSAAEATFGRLANLPRGGTPYEPGEARFAGLRYLPISRFRKYLVFYRPTDDGIEVLHGSRDLSGLLADNPEDAGPDDPDQGPL